MDTSTQYIQQLPIFPLPLVLFPGGLLPLQIFEVRYLDMIKHCHRDQRPFGVVATLPPPSDRSPRAVVEESRRLDQDGIEGFAPEMFVQVGCLAHINQLERSHPGVMNIECIGGQRFQIQSCEQKRYGLWVADVVLMDNDPIIPVPPDLIPSSETLQHLVRNMEQQLDNISQMPIALPYHWNDCGWLANRWCELLPVDTMQKQRLMSLNNPLVRLELITDMLDPLGLSRRQSD